MREPIVTHLDEETGKEQLTTLDRTVTYLDEEKKQLTINPDTVSIKYAQMIMENLTKTSRKDIAIVCLSSVLALISALIYPEAAYRLSQEKKDDILMTFLKIFGTTGANGMLNFYFIYQFLHSMLTDSNLYQIGIQPKKMGYVGLTLKLTVGLAAAFPLALLSQDSILPKKFNLFMLLIQSATYTSLQYYSAAQIYERIIDCVNRKCNPRRKNEVNHSEKIIRAMETKVEKLKFFLKSNAYSQKNQIIFELDTQLLEVLQKLKNNTDNDSEKNKKEAMARIMSIVFLSDEIDRVVTTKTLEKKSCLNVTTALTALVQLTSVSTMLAYTHSTERGLENAWGDPDLAWIFTFFSMSIFSYLILALVKNIVNSMSNKVYQMSIDTKKPYSGLQNEPSVLQFLGCHLLTNSMYSLPVFSMLSLIGMYFLGAFSWATCVYLLERSAEDMFHFMKPIDLWIGMAIFSTILFNNYAARFVIDGMCSSILRTYYSTECKGRVQLLLDTLDKFLSDLKMAGDNNVLYIFANLCGVNNTSDSQNRQISEEMKMIILKIINGDDAPSKMPKSDDPSEEEPNYQEFSSSNSFANAVLFAKLKKAEETRPSSDSNFSGLFKRISRPKAVRSSSVTPTPPLLKNEERVQII